MSPDGIVFTFLACADLKRTWEAIAMSPAPWSAGTGDNLAAAEDFASEFSRHCKLLAKNPDMGAERDELPHGLRSSPFRNYVVFYRVRGDRVEVLRVLRASQDVGKAG